MSFIVCFEYCGPPARGIAANVGQHNLSSYSSALAGTKHDPPVVGGIFFEQQNLKLSSGISVGSTKARGKHARIVENQNIAATQVLKQIAKLPMFDLTGMAMQDQQPGLVAFGSRGLSN